MDEQQQQVGVDDGWRVLTLAVHRDLGYVGLAILALALGYWAGYTLARR